MHTYTYTVIQKDDLFTWKHERVFPNEVKGGYVVGVKESRDIFQPKVVPGPRNRKPNSLYADYC